MRYLSIHVYIYIVYISLCFFFLLITMWEKEKRKSELPHLLFNYLFSSITTDFRRLH